MLLLLLALLAGMAVMTMLGAASGIGSHLPIGKFFPFAKKPEGRKMVEKKKANEVAMQVALALATGGAGDYRRILPFIRQNSVISAREGIRSIGSSGRRSRL